MGNSLDESNARLIKPLFVNGNFNRDGKRIRAKHAKDVSCAGGSYSLWVNAGSRDNDYPRSENDTHYLYALIGEYLIPCGVTEYKLEQDAGYAKLITSVYGNSDERERQFDELRHGKNWDESDSAIKTKIAEENRFVDEHKNDSEAQAEYIKSIYDICINRYVDARDNGGKFPDYIGAAILGELERCIDIAAVLRAERDKRDAQRRGEAAEQKKKNAEEQARKDAEAIQEAENIFRNGGKLYDGRMIVNLADKHGIDIPLRTKGWILNTFAECTIKDGDITSLRFYKRKGGNGSTKIWEILRDMQNVIINSEWVDSFLGTSKENAV